MSIFTITRSLKSQEGVLFFYTRCCMLTLIKGFFNPRKGVLAVYTAITLAKYIVTKCVNDNVPISNLQLQKILYYIQKYYLSNGGLAFSDEIEAWQFGPVVPDVYYRFCVFGAMPITSTYNNVEIAPIDASIIDRIVEEKRMLNPWDMVRETHAKHGAWHKTYRDGAGNHQIIPHKWIKGS